MILFTLSLFCLLEPAPEAEREASLAAMKEQAAQTRITAERTGDEKAAMVAAPLFRYSDEQRKIADATLWGFHDHGRPVAFLKVERYPTFPREHYHPQIESGE